MFSLRPAMFAVAALLLGPLSCTHDFDSFETLGGETTPDATAGVGVDAAGSDAAGATDAASDGAVTASDAGDAGNINAGLVAYYKFDETSGTSCADSSGNNHTATLSGGSFSPGLENNAVTFNGTTQYVSLPSGIVNGFTTFSISMWVKLTANANWARMFDFGTGTTTYLFLAPATSAGTMRFAITTGGSGAEQRLDTSTLPTGGWQHVVVILGGTTGTIYVNGASAVQQAITLSPSSLGSTTQNYIGRSQFAADPYLNGQVDNLRIYDRALSLSEVQELFTQKE